MSELLASPFNDCCDESPCCSVGSLVDFQFGCGDAIYDTLAQLKAAPADVFPTSSKRIFWLVGLEAAYDTTARIYVSDPTNGDTPDDYSRVECDNFGGRLILLFG